MGPPRSGWAGVCRSNHRARSNVAESHRSRTTFVGACPTLVAGMERSRPLELSPGNPELFWPQGRLPWPENAGHSRRKPKGKHMPANVARANERKSKVRAV